MTWVKAICLTVIGMFLIIVDRYFIKKWSTQEQTNFSNRTNERYLKNMILRNYMRFTYYFTILGVILILLAINEFVFLIFGIEIFGVLKELVKSFFPIT